MVCRPDGQPASQGESAPTFGLFGGHIKPENLLDLNFGDAIPGF
jgi:hypothetical protein